MSERYEVPFDLTYDEHTIALAEQYLADPVLRQFADGVLDYDWPANKLNVFHRCATLGWNWDRVRNFYDGVFMYLRGLQYPNMRYDVHGYRPHADVDGGRYRKLYDLGIAFARQPTMFAGADDNVEIL